MIFSEVGLLGLNSIFGSKKAPFFSIADSWEGLSGVLGGENFKSTVFLFPMVYLFIKSLPQSWSLSTHPLASSENFNTPRR
jgi:hypothetical protein